MNFDSYFNYQNGSITYGLTNELISFYVLNYFKKNTDNLIIVTSNLYEANKLYNSLIMYSDRVKLFPMDDFVSAYILSSSPEFKIQRLNVLDKIQDKNEIIITNLMGYLKYLPNKNVNKDVEIKINEIINRDELINKLEEFGYNRDSMTTMTGEYSLRGFIIDIFPVNEEHPIRIEFDDKKVESIRYYNENNQRTIDNVSSIKIKPINEIETKEKSSLYDYCNNPTVLFINKDQIMASYYKLSDELLNYNPDEKIMYEINEINAEKELFIDNISNKSDIEISSIPNINEDFDYLKSLVENWQSKNKEVYFYLTNKNQIKIIKELIPSAQIINEQLNEGFIFDKYVCITDSDIGTTIKNVKYKNNLHIGKKIRNYNELEKGDYIVHINHGIGIYNGIKTLTNRNIEKDYIELLYEDNDKIYVPVERINSIYKYSSKDGLVPKINKLNSSSWAKTKTVVMSKAKDISKELLELYKKRASIQGEVYKDYVEQDVFRASFEYEETDDQKRAINEILQDLSSPVPMDRLLCGDVGFGKTEVAMQSIFKTVYNDRQVMYLCPTTILSKQQYEVIKERFKNVPVEIKLLNRFTSSKETTKILKDFNEGKIDILVGTHRILSDDVKALKLGLLVVDEEQRFGVKHKEKIKEMKNDINVLTLSATPIPRTLKMALSGLRDLSIIDTPPVNRFPVQTYVTVENDLLIKDAIYKEMSRNGQVFVLYNKIENIENIVSHLNNLVPDAKIRFAHGQMNKDELDEIMNDFVNYQFDILVCTTIIENGIDISNANTIIVYDADNFGLSQLYQIRGRVGRSDRIAYAYLLYNDHKELNEIAVKRLQAIKEFTELGSGYKIAMRDLAIRGAGDIFGSSQAGYVDSVGVSLYMKLIEDEMKKLKGEYVDEDEDTNPLINVSTHIKDSYITDEDIKIEIHQKINEIDSLTKLKQIKSELEDRFGKIDTDLEIYMYEEWFESMAKELNIDKIITTDRFIEITLPTELSQNIKGDKLLFSTLNISNKFNIKYLHNNIIITLFYKGLPEHYIYYITKLLEVIKDN